MKVLDILKKVRFHDLWKLAILSLKNPWFIWPTIAATKETMSVSDHYFGNLHHQNGPANAFRHALWNYLIAKKCTKWSKNNRKVLKWTKDITDWHERAFTNRELARKMDYHNNAVGRQLFIDHIDQEVPEMAVLLQKMTNESTFIKEGDDLEQLKTQLVHISK
ncbi:MAG: hypothetical protein CMH48_06305 [Muricauda sp.]|nr:hypothetical protein [Allomuricauda sp.]MAU27011.1 hypothetical protein [Allomuricauda sp.]MBC30441.1 hypothetical protein [Allomuricauda sp.]|tara:strand:- start:31334 stop:31822 length:489 start_codon:yes stop_codon:yes gene_type:complete